MGDERDAISPRVEQVYMSHGNRLALSTGFELCGPGRSTADIGAPPKMITTSRSTARRSVCRRIKIIFCEVFEIITEWRNSSIPPCCLSSTTSGLLLEQALTDTLQPCAWWYLLVVRLLIELITGIRLFHA